jgi:DNA-binding transcriptional MerR regulator
MNQRTLSAGKVAAAFGVAPVTVRTWAEKGRIPCSKTLGGHWRFDLAEVRRVINHGVLPERHSAVATTKRIAESSISSPSNLSGRYLEDGKLRAVIDFRDALRKADQEGFRILVSERPSPLGDCRWDAFVAAVIEDEAERKAVPAPQWVHEDPRFAQPEWSVAPYPQFLESERAASPPAFLRHGVIAGEESLASV